MLKNIECIYDIDNRCRLFLTPILARRFMSRLFSVIDAVRSSAAPSVVLSQKITKANRVSKLLSGFACLLAITNGELKYE
jgi:hypothetical protein